MANRTTSRERRVEEQRQKTKRGEEMIIIRIDEVADEPPAVPATRSPSNPSISAGTSAPNLPPATPYLTPLPLTHLPLPTIETMLSYPSLPQPLYDSLLRGEPPATNYNTVTHAPRVRTDSNSSDNSMDSTAPSEAASDTGKEDFHSAYEEFPFPTPPSLSPNLSTSTSSSSLSNSFSQFSLHEDALGGGPLCDDFDDFELGSLNDLVDMYGDGGVIYGAAGLAMSPRTMAARKRNSGFWAMASGFDGVGALEKIEECPGEEDERNSMMVR